MQPYLSATRSALAATLAPLSHRANHPLPPRKLTRKIPNMTAPLPSPHFRRQCTLWTVVLTRSVSRSEGERNLSRVFIFWGLPSPFLAREQHGCFSNIFITLHDVFSHIYLFGEEQIKTFLILTLIARQRASMDVSESEKHRVYSGYFPTTIFWTPGKMVLTKGASETLQWISEEFKTMCGRLSEIEFLYSQIKNGLIRKCMRLLD